MQRLFPLFLSLIIVSGCSKEVDGPYEECFTFDCLEFHPIYLRVENSSSYDFTIVEVSPGGGEMHDFGALASGDTSEYFLYNDGGFHYGSILTVTSNNDTLALSPSDYVGETPLETGYYSYVFSGSNGTLGSLFRED